MEALFLALKAAPTWFLLVIITALFAAFSVLFGFLVFILRRSLNKLDSTLDRTTLLIDRLFGKYDNHERRLSRLEGEHHSNHLLRSVSDGD